VRRDGHVTFGIVMARSGQGQMKSAAEYEDWLLDDGESVVQRRSTGEVLTELDRLVHCLWWLDYGMRNAGDLETVLDDAHPSALTDGLEAAKSCGLPTAARVFGQSRSELERRYFDEFEGLCAEIIQARRAAS
jgi:hypothetical protein